MNYGGQLAADRLPPLARAADELEAAGEAAEAVDTAVRPHTTLVDGRVAARAAGIGLGHQASVAHPA